MTSPAPRWVVVIPVKSNARAKSRLRHQQRAELAIAMAIDTIGAVTASPLVDEVLVVTKDPAVAAAVTHTLGSVVPDNGGGDLNACLVSVIAEALSTASVAVFVADLPSARTRQVTELLSAASSHPFAVVADRAGVGTTVLLAAAPQALRPAFGTGSFARHRALGAADLSDRAGPGLRLDVDTIDDLRLAVASGVGPATATIIGDGSSLRP